MRPTNQFQMKSRWIEIKRIKLSFISLTMILLFLLAGCDNIGQAAVNSNTGAGKEAIDIALLYKSKLPSLSAGDFSTLSKDTMNDIMELVANSGFAVTEASGELGFRNPSVVTDFFSKLKTSSNAHMTIIEICYDGGLVKSDITVNDDKRTITMTRVAWKDEKPEITLTEENNLLDLRYTDKGYLIYKRDIPNNTGCNHDGYIEPTTMIRVTPLDPKCREYCKKYISIIGYSRNNLFLTDWTSDDMSSIVINDLFLKLYNASHAEALMLNNCPYETNTQTGYTSIPAGDFEPLIMKYFDITSEELKKLAAYNADTDTYPIAASEIFDPGYSIPPEPEVVDYKENKDGTLTLFVDAMYLEKGTDKAFSHAVTIKTAEDGSYKYISNHVIPTAGDMLLDYVNPYKN